MESFFCVHIVQEVIQQLCASIHSFDSCHATPWVQLLLRMQWRISLLLSWCGSTVETNGFSIFRCPSHEKNVRKRGFVPVLPTSKMHWSVYLISCQMHESRLSHQRCAIGNPTIVCISALFCQMLLFVPQLLSWGPLTPSCQLPVHNTDCCQQFVGHVWFLLHLALGMCQGGGGLGLQCWIVLVWVSKVTSVPACEWCAHIPVIFSWYNLAWIYPLFDCYNPNWVGSHSTGSPSIFGTWIILLNAWYQMVHIILVDVFDPKNCRPPRWKWLV